MRKLLLYGSETPGDESVWPFLGVVETADEQWLTLAWFGLFVAVYIGACKQPD